MSRKGYLLLPVKHLTTPFAPAT